MGLDQVRNEDNRELQPLTPVDSEDLDRILRRYLLKRDWEFTEDIQVIKETR